MKQRLPIPGFVDLQVNGFEGVDFSRAGLTEAEAYIAFRSLLGMGTAAFLATVITSPLEVYERNLPLIARALARPEFRGRVLGIHIEGPFISAEPGAVGAHDARFVRPPDAALLARLIELGQGTVRLLTVAPEIPGADRLIRDAVGKGVAVSIGHTLASELDLAKAAAAGATALTHLGNGLPNQVHRHINPVWAGLANDALTAMIITDGHHLPPALIKTIIRAKGVDRIVVVSDASPAAGLPPGRYQLLGNDAVLEPSGRLHNPAKQCLVGSSATMVQCMTHLVSLGIVSLDELLQVGFFNPLRLIGAPPASVPAGPGMCFDPVARRFET